VKSLAGEGEDDLAVGVGAREELDPDALRV